MADYAEFFTGAMDISHPYAAPKYRWHVDELLRVGTINLLAGQPKAGKSFLARQLAAATATGGKFLGRDTHQGRTVLFALEESQHEVREHLTSLGVHTNIIIVPVGYAIPADAPARLARMLDADEHINLVIIDTLFKFVRVEDVNQYQQVNDALAPLANLAASRDVTILATHHASKTFTSAGESILGSNAIRGGMAVNLILQYDRTKDMRSLCAEGRGVNFPAIELMDSPDGFSVLGDNMALAKARRRQERKLSIVESRVEQIISTVSGASNATIADIMAVTGGSKTDVQREIRSLVKKGTLVKTGTGSKTSPFRYSTATEEAAA
jgi:hypothetical protein